MGGKRFGNLTWAVVAVFVIVVTVWLGNEFLSTYFCSTNGEKLGALGGVLGGLIGALGAALAVSLTLRGQRRDETDTIRDAARREIQEFSRLVAGHLDVCREIAAGTAREPRRDLPTIMVMPKPVIYEAIADRIGRLERAENYVTFHARIAEAERLVAILAASGQPDVVTGARVAPLVPMGKQDIAVIASSWIDVGSIAMHILNPQPRPADYEDEVERSFRSSLEEALQQARAVFADDSDAA